MHTIRAKHKQKILIGGDFNLPDINWLEQTITNRQYPMKTNQAFLVIAADEELEQVVDFPTHKDNTLDLLVTSHPAFKLRCKPLLSIGNNDHDMVLLDMDCKPFKPKRVRWKIFLGGKADIYKIKEDIAILNTTCKNIDRNVKSKWQAFETAIQNIIDKRIPPKLTQDTPIHG